VPEEGCQPALGFPVPVRYATTVRTLIALLVFIASLRAADRFTGWQSCASSGCHGGGTGKDQIQIMLGPDGNAREAHRDVHRGINTPGIGRSIEIAKALGIADFRKSSQCLVCHSPMETVPKERLAIPAPNLDVSCETCHGPAENWLRYHTRPDITYAQRVAAGMHDMRTPYQRANTCVGCHTNISPALQKAGHPELRFELGRQIANLPPHWRGTEQPGRNWITGQAVLLRELCWQVEKNAAPPDVPERIRAIHWLLRETSAGAYYLPDPKADTIPSALREAADKMARGVSAQEWEKGRTRELFDKAIQLSSTLGAEKPEVQLRRAQAITRALGALARGLDPKAGETHKTELLALENSVLVPEKFDLALFTDTATKLRIALAAKP
jgi:hypothetical protein